MREQVRPGARWFAYQNHALDSFELGQLWFLQVGEGCTFSIPPKSYPDCHLGIGWRYLLIGAVNLESGLIEPLEEA